MFLTPACSFMEAAVEDGGQSDVDSVKGSEPGLERNLDERRKRSTGGTVTCEVGP